MLNLNFSVYRQKGKLIFFNCHFCIIMENDSTKSVMDRSFVIPNSESKVWVLVCGIFDNIFFIYLFYFCCVELLFNWFNFFVNGGGRREVLWKFKKNWNLGTRELKC